MRIISGTHKGRRLVAPKKLTVRPTTDRAKEALFNILQHQWEWNTTSVLDLFAGTGSISYEFGSRGVKNMTAVDQNSSCIHYIQKTSEKLHMAIHSIQCEVFKYLYTSHSRFDLIFADPPYNMDAKDYFKLIDLIFEKDILAEGGLLIVEHGEHMNFETHPRRNTVRKYGSNRFSFFKK